MNELMWFRGIFRILSMISRALAERTVSNIRTMLNSEADRGPRLQGHASCYKGDQDRRNEQDDMSSMLTAIPRHVNLPVEYAVLRVEFENNLISPIQHQTLR